MRAPLSAVGAQQLGVVAAGRRRAHLRRLVIRIWRCAFQRTKHDRDVPDILGHGTWRVLIGGDRNDAVAADAADRRLHRGEHVLVRRTEDRSGRFRADVTGPEIRGGADAGARTAGLQNGTAVTARIAPRVVGIHAVAVHGVVVRRHAGGDVIGQLGQAGLGDDDGAGVAQIPGERGFVGRDQPLEREGAARRPHVRRVDVVLQRDRDAVQRSADAPLGTLAVERVGFLQRFRVDGDGRVEQVLVLGDAREVLLHDLVRGEASRLHRRLHVGDAGLEDVEAGGFGGSAGRLLRRQHAAEEQNGDGDGKSTFHWRPVSWRCMNQLTARTRSGAPFSRCAAWSAPGRIIHHLSRVANRVKSLAPMSSGACGSRSP